MAVIRSALRRALRHDLGRRRSRRQPCLCHFRSCRADRHRPTRRRPRRACTRPVRADARRQRDDPKVRERRHGRM